MDDFTTTSEQASSTPGSTPAAAVTTETKPATSMTEVETKEESGTSADSQVEGDEAGHDEDQPSEQGSEDKPRKGNGFKKRIDRLNRNLSERDLTIQNLQKELDQYKAPKNPSQSSDRSSDVEPNPDDFEKNHEYLKALSEYHRNQDKAEAKKQAEEIKRQEAGSKIQGEYNQKLETFKKTSPDFDKVVSEFRDAHGEFNASPAVMEALMTSEHGPEVLYEVLKDHAEYDRLSTMSEMAIIREIGKKEARIASKKESTQSKPIQKPTQAPKPPSPLGSSGSKVEKSYDDMSFDEFMTARNAESRRRRA